MRNRLMPGFIEKHLILLILIFNFIVFPKIQGKKEVRDLLKYVDQNLTVRTGCCTFGVSMPFGSIRPCPHTSSVGGRSYVATNKIVGFTNVNMGSLYKYVNLLVSPQIGLDCWDDNNGSTGHDSGKANEICQPDYYSVDLTKFGIKTEITPSNFSAIYRFTYPEAKDGMASMVIYPSHSFWADCTYSTVKFDSTENTISGYLVTNDGWYFSRSTIYYAIQFSKPLLSHGMFNNKEKKLYEKSDTISGDGVGCYLKFNTLKDEKVFMKVSISTKSVENAKKFLSDEISKWNFDKVRTNAEKTWNKALSSILIDDGTISSDEKKSFYTALYFTQISPKNRTGDCPWNYSGPYHDDAICVWDSFRSQYPLLTLINESAVRDKIISSCEIFKHYGYSYDALLGGQGDMIQGGDDVDVLVADAYAKGVSGINWNDAYNMLKVHADVSGRAPLYIENDRGWVPFNSISKMAYATASKSLEFNYNDFCASQVAGRLGFEKDKQRFQKRSSQWINLWDNNTESDGFKGFIQAKDSTGNFVSIDPKTNPNGSFSLYFYEGNSWTYSFYMPHQMKKLIELMGGDVTFTKRLEHYVGDMIEISNEPCFLTPYLFDYVSRPDLASFYVRKVAKVFTTNNDYPGDDDSGAMSSWFIFSRLGFFPVAGQDVYLINGPRYKKVTIQMENGKKIVINGDGASSENQYIKSATLNGKELNQTWIKHSELKNGATVDFNMSATPSNWGFKGKLPPSY